MTNDTEHIWRGTDDPSFYKTFQNPKHAVQEQAVSMKSASDSDDEGPLSSRTPVSDIPPTIPELLVNQIFLSCNRQTTQEEARRLYAIENDTSIIKGGKTRFLLRSGLIMKRSTMA